MTRRDLILLALGLALLPDVAQTEQSRKVYRIGILETIPTAQNSANLNALRKGLRELGYIEGKNLIIEYRSADGKTDAFSALASELLDMKLDVIVTRGTPATSAVEKANAAIPVIMATMGKMTRFGQNLAHPGGNITGMTTFSTELIGKRIELLKELVHGMSRVALLHNMDNAAAKPEWEETESAAHALGLHSELLDVRDLDDLHAAFDAGRQKRVDALIVGADGLTLVHKRTIVDLAERYRLPASYPSREFVEAGGLLAYGINYSELYYRFAAYIDKILKGTKPADLPIEQPTKFDLAINIKTAKALGLTVPQLLLAQANEVLE